MFGHHARMQFVVWSTPHPGVEDRYHRWYDEVHLPDAIENGSFVAMHRYRAVGDGYRAAPYLSVAEADYPDEESAWAYVRPRALALREEGRVEDLYRVDQATMLLTVEADMADRTAPVLTTVQNDWRHPGGDAHEWLAAVDVPADVWHSRQLFTTDPAGTGGPGRHLAFFESNLSLDEVAAAWGGIGAAGSSPVPPYTTLYGVTDDRDRSDEPGPQPVWVMHWEHLITVGR